MPKFDDDMEIAISIKPKRYKTKATCLRDCKESDKEFNYRGFDNAIDLTQ